MGRKTLSQALTFQIFIECKKQTRVFNNVPIELSDFSLWANSDVISVFQTKDVKWSICEIIEFVLKVMFKNKLHFNNLICYTLDKFEFVCTCLYNHWLILIIHLPIFSCVLK